MGVVEEDKAGRGHACWQRVTRLPHDQEDDRDSQRAQSRGQSPVRHVRNFVGDVGISNIFEQKFPLIANKVAHEGEQKLAEGRVHVEEVGPLEVVGRKLVAVVSFNIRQWILLRFGSNLAKVYFVKHDLIRVI